MKFEMKNSVTRAKIVDNGIISGTKNVVILHFQYTSFIRYTHKIYSKRAEVLIVSVKRILRLRDGTYLLRYKRLAPSIATGCDIHRKRLLCWTLWSDARLKGANPEFSHIHFTETYAKSTDRPGPARQKGINYLLTCRLLPEDFGSPGSRECWLDDYLIPRREKVPLFHAIRLRHKRSHALSFSLFLCHEIEYVLLLRLALKLAVFNLMTKSSGYNILYIYIVYIHTHTHPLN